MNTVIAFKALLKYIPHNRKNWMWLITAVMLAIFMLPRPFVIEPELTDHGPSWLGIDNSWALAFSYANSNQWVYGKDVVYTYGPLAFLATRIAYGTSKWIFLLFDLFIVFNLTLVFYRFITGVVNQYLGFLTMLCCVLLIRVYIGVGISWIMLFLTYSWLYWLYEKPTLLKLISLNLIICISFFLKLNSGLIGVVLYISALFIIWLLKRISLQTLLISVTLPFILILILSYVLHVHLPGYTLGALELIRGYNDTMLLDHEPELKNLNTGVGILFYAYLLFYMVIANSLIKEKNLAKIAFAMLPLLYLFLLKKQSTIRCDNQHLHEFYSYISLILLALPPLVASRKEKIVYSKGAILLSVTTLLIASEQTPFLSAVSNRFGTLSEYVSTFTIANKINYLNQKQKRFIPKHLLDSVGTKTIDVIPWDSEYIIQNKLNYSPRPVFQSFSVYTNYLQQVNNDAYTRKPPEFILYDIDAIDGRYPIHDETRLHLYILKNYTVCDTFMSNERMRLLLKKNEHTSPLNFLPVCDTILPVSGSIQGDTKADFFKIKLKYSLWGKMESVLGRAPKIKLCIETQDGETTYWTTSVSLLEAGIWTGDLVKNVNDITRIIKQGGMHQIKSVSIRVNPAYFEETMHVEGLQTDAVQYSSKSSNLSSKTPLLSIRPDNFNKGSAFQLNNEIVAALWGGSISTRSYHFIPGTYTVQITHSGTAADNEFPFIRVNTGEMAVDSFYTSELFTRRTLTLRFDKEVDVSFSFDMVNDLQIPERNEDRNAFFKSVDIYRND